jgi:uncharacterized protein
VEEHIHFSSEDHQIEGLFEAVPEDRGVVITHPHPLYGGDMYNPVVETVRGIYHSAGYSTLRFNFRGTGESQGRYDEGVGEQKDVIGAVSFLEKTGITTVDLCGYSFGAWVIAHMDSDFLPVDKKVLISPPVRMMEFGSFTAISRLNQVITGSRDDIAPPELIKRLLPQWNSEARFEEIPGADHFYSGHIESLASVIWDGLFDGA